ncbi:sensor histidine kinase [Streptomyces kanamyceticus]|uniref:histidine kinase n=1 Tax=Streptomyces kanamyceticus TaxID=1967 RepID=A0A5J6G902_STRKN|nr:histidine kinase [Streptomyces kanamyceticus]QEU90271.1 sensor histidine kinase [Streptomyces kanamyceticus]
MTPRTALEALTARPLGFLGSAWPWRALGYLLSGGPLGVGAWVAVAGLVASRGRIGGWAAAVCAVLVLAFVTALAGPLERARLPLIAPDVRIAGSGGSGGTARTAGPGADGSRAVVYGAVSVLAAGWIDLGVVFVSLGVPGVLLSAPLQPDAPVWAAFGGPVAGALLLPVAAYPITAWAGARGSVARAVLASGDAELSEVRQSRARLVDAYEAERRRIERDLHDGAQQRLVALTMKLGLAGLDLPPGSRAAREVADAHRMAKDALTELRELIRGVHPQVLTERGLPAAVRDVAGRSAIPVDIALDLPHRPPPSVEVAAYFAVCEALANAAKHSGALRCRVEGRLRDGVVEIEVSDDGRGGADATAGTGLTGTADRIAAVGGRMLLSSPVGGPTRLRMEIPCGD